MELKEIMENVRAMQIVVRNGASLDEILREFGEFKRYCPRLFETVLENKENYMPVLKKLEQAAKMVNVGKATKKEMDKIIDYRLTEEYVFPSLDMNDSVQDSIKKHMKEVEELESRLEFKSRPDDDEDDDFVTTDE